MPFEETLMDPEIVILSEASQTEEENSMQNLKKIIQVNLFSKPKHTNLREGTYGYWREESQGGIVREFGIDIYTLVYSK